MGVSPRSDTVTRTAAFVLILATFAVATTGGTVTHAVFFDAESVSVGVGVEPSEATRVILRDSETDDDRTGDGP